MRDSMKKFSLDTLITGLFLLLFLTSNAFAENFVSINTSPSSIPADGHSQSQIYVMVLDSTGKPVSDGTEVHFSTTAGDVSPVRYTSGGRAVGMLTSSNLPQIATITITVGGASASAQVEFTSKDEIQTETKILRMEGGSEAYSIDRDTIMASQDVSLEYKHLTIHAASVQVNAILGQIRAQGGVVVEKENQKVTGDALTLDLRSRFFRILRTDGKNTQCTYDINRLTQIGMETVLANTQDFDPLTSLGTKNWIVSQRLTLIPGEKILFVKAAIYIGNTRVIRVPYYSYDYSRRETLLQQVKYTSADGMQMDLPFYYHVADSNTGALRMRYSSTGDTEYGSSYRPRKGLSLGLDQSYTINENNQGRVFYDSLGSTSQAWEVSHRVTYGSGPDSGRADISARFQPTNRYAKDLYNTTANLYGGFSKYSYSVSGYLSGSRNLQYNYLNPNEPTYIGQSDSSIRSNLRFRDPILLGKSGRLTPNFTLGYARLGDAFSYNESPRLFQSLGIDAHFGKATQSRTYLNFDNSASYTMTINGKKGVNLKTGPTLYSRWRGGSGSLGYSLNYLNGTTDGISQISKHLITGNMFINSGSLWNDNISLYYGLDTGRFNLYSFFNLNLPKKLQMRANYSYYRYKNFVNNYTYSFVSSYLKMGIYHPIGPYEIGLAWSPVHKNSGFDQNKRISLEFGMKGF